MFPPNFLTAAPRVFFRAAVVLLLLAGSARAVDLTQKSVSASRQFSVFCEDVAARARVASFAEEVKADVLRVLGQDDRWKHPILITLEPASPADGAPARATLGLFQTVAGFKVEISVRIGDRPEAVNLQKHLVRAVMLELAYRERPQAVRGGETYLEAPWWLVEGALQLIRQRDIGAETGLFKKMIEANRLPPIAQLLAEKKPGDFGSTAEALDQACAMCLVQLLVEQPNGRACLGNLLRHLPDGEGDAVAALTREFPALASDAQSLQKWWTLNLARLSAADRYKGLTPEETDAQLTALLHFEISDKAGETKSFGIGEFERFVKLPAARAAMLAGQAGVIALSAQASALYRPILAEYEQVFGLLAKGKAHGIKARLDRTAQYRESILRRTTEISDYLNWFEATQMETRSDAFDGYLKAANELATPLKRNDPVTQYLDEVEAEFAPGI